MQSNKRELYLYLLKEDGSALQYIPDEYKTFVMCKVAIENDPKAIKYVPLELLEDDICLLAIKTNPENIKLLPVNKLTEDFYLKAVEENIEILKYIPHKEFTSAIIDVAINKDVRSLSYLPDNLLDDETIMGIITQVDPFALKWIPKSWKTEEMCRVAVINKAKTIKYVPKKFQTQSFFETVIKGNGLALEYLPSEFLTKELSLAAVSQNGEALAYVKEEWREDIINELTVEKIIINNYAARQYIPAHYQEKINAFLKNVTHIVVTATIDKKQDQDNEINDIYIIYANSSKRKQKIIRVDYTDIYPLLNDIQVEHKRSKILPLNLVLLGHFEEGITKVGGLAISDIIDILKAYPDIQTVNLLSCNTTKSLKLDKEIELIKNYKPIDRGNNIVIYMNALPKLPFDFNKKFAKLNAKFNDYNNLYIITAPEGNSTYCKVTCIEQKKAPSEYQSHQVSYDTLKSILNHNNNLPFPRDTGGKKLSYSGARILKKFELDEMLNWDKNTHRFLKGHKDYEADKENYPFLRGFTIDKNEADTKLQDSFLKELYEAILKEPDIKQNIQIKGYPRGLYVDTKEKQLHVTKTYLYRRKFYPFSTYTNDEDFLKRKDLKTEQTKNVKALSTRNVAGETMAKSIKVRLNSGKK